jgi:hypothetical protein
MDQGRAPRTVKGRVCLEGFPEELEKFYTLDEISFMNHHLRVLSERQVEREARRVPLTTLEHRGKPLILPPP